MTTISCLTLSPSTVRVRLLPKGDSKVLGVKSIDDYDKGQIVSIISNHETSRGLFKVIQRIDSEGVLNVSLIAIHPNQSALSHMRFIVRKLSGWADYVNLVSEDCVHFLIFP